MGDIYMTRKHMYDDYVNDQAIDIQEDKKNKLRYLLEIPLNSNKSKSVLVILKNPSKASKTKSDYTINKVIKFCKQENYSKIYIMNLFPYYSTNPQNVRTFINNTNLYKTSMENNSNVLKRTLNNVDDVIVSWGTNTIGNKKIYTSVVNLFTTIINDNFNIQSVYHVGSLNKNEYPLHARMWNYNMKKQLYKLK